MEFDESPPDPSGVVEIDFRLTDERYPFVRISDEESCKFELLRLLPRGERRYAGFFTVSGADPAAVAERVADAEMIEPTLLARDDSQALFEFEVTDGCPVVDVAMEGAIPVSVTSENGTGRITAEIVPPPGPATVIDEFQNGHPNATLVGKSEKDPSVPLFTRRELAQTLTERLTERQTEVLRTAYEAGYYSRPRDVTGEEVADRLDISVATFSQHLRVAEQTLVGILVDDGLV